MSKAVEFIYQDTKIHFLMGGDENVMINATEMAKAFGRRTKDFLKTDHASAFIKVLERALNGAHSPEEIINNRGHMGIYFHRVLALKFAAWLDPEFELWVYSKIDELLFGHYKELDKKLRDSAERKKKIEALRSKLADNPDFLALQTLETEDKQASYRVGKQIKNQLDMFMNN